jgi:hypothetical protein
MDKWIKVKNGVIKQNVCSICCGTDDLYVLVLNDMIVKIELRPESKMHDFVLCSKCIKKLQRAQIWKE